ncbi:MAG: hypothetical protein HY805_05960 [Nitrospirae bacterium]|nr:hypothetical protein [Nitrospirota bacterium]
MELFGIAITILAAILTYQAWKNGRWMKQAHQDTQNLIKEMHKDTTESFKKMDDTLRHMDETAKESFKRMDDTAKEIAKKTEDTLRYIADLIVAEGQKTRAVIEK